jgi:ABC-type branched-subunit amino acid transport system ATPase component
VTPVLEATGVSVSFGGVRALDDVSLAVPPSTIVGLLGPNGAGKTTLFGVLSGLLRPDRGVVRMDGEEVTSASPQARARRGLARTFQRLELFGELSVRDHLVIAYRARNRRLRLVSDLLGFGNRPDPGEADAVDDILELLDLAAVAAAPARSLPLGTGRLVELARALASRPRVLLLDEPTSGLDSEETRVLAAALRDISRARGVALVVVEHDVEMVLSLASSVTVLDFGRVIAEGDASKIREDAGVRAAYLGAAPA